MNSISDELTNERKPRRPRGTGRLYQPKGNLRWYIQYYRDGKCIREATGTTNKSRATKLLQKRLAQIATHTYVEPKAEKTLAKELFDGLRLDYENNDRKSWEDVKTRWKLHLEPVFGNIRATNVSNGDLNQYINDRKKQGASNGTINRELSALKRMFTLGLKARKVPNSPDFPHLEERNVRKGFVEDAQYDQLAAACAKEGLWLRAMFEAGYNFGWRVSELLNLRVKQVDLASRMLRLEPGETKNDEGREAYMPELMYLLIQQCVVGKKPEESVFTRTNGRPIKDFRASWWKACIAAGLGSMICRQCDEAVSGQQCPQCKTGRRGLKYVGLIFHDLRRTAVRNMVKDRTPEKVAMQITGHKTRSVFDRYHIVDATDKKLAAQRMEERMKAQQQKAAPREFEHQTGIILPSAPIANAAKPN